MPGQVFLSVGPGFPIPDPSSRVCNPPTPPPPTTSPVHEGGLRNQLPRIHSKDPQPKRTKSNIPPRSPPCSFVFISTCEQHLTKIYRDFSQNLAYFLYYNYGRQIFSDPYQQSLPDSRLLTLDSRLPCPNPKSKIQNPEVPFVSSCFRAFVIVFPFPAFHFPLSAFHHTFTRPNELYFEREPRRSSLVQNPRICREKGPPTGGRNHPIARMMASAISWVPTAVGSSRSGFRSKVTSLALGDDRRPRRFPGYWRRPFRRCVAA